jgi:GT2 family glycosyltransferase
MVYIIILNWNGWRDTIECLESVFRNDHENCRVIVCDNASTDGSLDRIKQWADGKLNVSTPESNSLRHLSFPPIQKPVAYCEYTRREAEAGGDENDRNTKLILIQTGANLGFAGGNNVGLRYALAQNDFEYVWLLNNDTAIKPDTLTRLIETTRADNAIGMCGSTLLFYHHPSVVQTLGGGTYNRQFGTSQHIDEYRTFTGNHKEILVEQMDYVMGASMLVPKAFLKAVGLLSEAYFLYFEELDWAARAKGSFKLGYAPKSIVYHKGGQSVGNRFKELSTTSVFYSVRSRLIFTRKFYPQFLPLVYARLFVLLLNQTLKGNAANARAFETLVHRHDKRILAMVLRFSRNSDDAKDLYQEIFMRVFRALPKFEFKSEFSTWLYRIATNVCLSHSTMTASTRQHCDSQTEKVMLRYTIRLRSSAA